MPELTQKERKQSYSNDTSSSKKTNQTSSPQQLVANNSPQGQQAAQLQAMADNSAQVKQAAQLQNMADTAQLKKSTAPVAQLFSDEDTATLKAMNPAPNDEQIAEMDRFTLQQVQTMYAAVNDWAQVVQLAGLNRSADHLVALLGMDTAPSAAQIIAIERFTLQQTQTIYAAVNDWAQVVQLAGLNRSADHLVALLGMDTAPSTAHIIALEPFNQAQLLTVYNDIRNWAEVTQLTALTRSPADLAALFDVDNIDYTPTVAELTALDDVSNVNVIKLLNYVLQEEDEDDEDDENENIWQKVISCMNIYNSEDVEEGMPNMDLINDMATAETDEEKRDVAGNLDENRSCWNWATQGFSNPAVPDQTIWDYFSLRTNNPPRDGVKNHEEAVDLVSNGDQGITDYLNRNEARMEDIIDTWVNDYALPEDGRTSEDANDDAQLAIMRLHLEESGFTLRNQGQASDWYICMHEEKGKVGFEHWWIKSRVGNVIETFPHGIDEDGVESGKYIAFHNLEINMGEPDTDFRHEVPVTGLLPQQEAIINRAFANKKAEITTLLNGNQAEEDADD